MTDKPSTHRVTLAQVAERAGVSAGAVSQVLNDHPQARISEDARERISRAVQELGYRPNMVARSLRMAKSHTFGFVSDSVTITRYATGILRGALEAADEIGYLLLIAETGGDPERERRAVESLLDRGVDGIVLTAMKSRRPGAYALPAGLPHVNVNLSHAEGTVSVLPDEFNAGRDAVRLLVEAGHADGIALIGHDLTPGEDPTLAHTARRRLDGIAYEMKRCGISPLAEFSSDDWQPEQGYEGALRALELPDLTAMLCLNDRIAVGAYQAVAEAGKVVAVDVSIVSFDDDEIASTLRPGLTTIAIPHEKMGATAIDLLTAQQQQLDDVLIPMDVVLRESIGSPTRS